MSDSVKPLNPRAPLLRDTPPKTAPAGELEPPRRVPEQRPASALPASERPAGDEPSTPLAASAGLLERGRWLVWALASAAGAVVLLLGAELVSLGAALADWHWALAVPVALLAVALIGFALLGALREWRQARRLTSLAKLRQQGETLLASDGYGGARPYISELMAVYRQRLASLPELAALERHQDSHRSDADQVQLLSSALATSLDAQAQRVIAGHVRRLGVFTALNPLALLDSLLVLWQTLRMVRQIADIYGGRPGLIGSWRLVREVALAVTAAGTGDLLADSAGDALGVGVAGMLSAKLSQGVITGLLVARVGLCALKLCRPVPLAERESELWQNLRKQVFSLIKS